MQPANQGLQLTQTITDSTITMTTSRVITTPHIHTIIIKFFHQLSQISRVIFLSTTQLLIPLRQPTMETFISLPTQRAHRTQAIK
jgi:hypothetical protein